MDMKRSIIVEIDGKGAAVGAKTVSDALREIDNNAKRASSGLGAFDATTSRLASDFDILQRGAKLTTEEMGRLQARAARVSELRAQEEALRNIAESAKLTKDEIHALGEQMGVSKGRINSLVGDIERSAKGFDALAFSTGAVKSLLPSLSAGFVGLKLGQLISESTMLAARYETLGVVMHTVGKNSGYTKAEMDGFASSLQKAGISMLEGRNVLTRMTQAQIDLTKASELARVAQDAAVIGNINSSEAFERMVYGIQSGQTEILRTIGINVNFEQSYRKIAEQLGKNVNDLTEAERSQARMNAAMEAGEGIAGTYANSMDTVGKKLSSTERLAEDAKVKLGELFSPAMNALVLAYYESLIRVAGVIEYVAEFTKWAVGIRDTGAVLQGQIQDIKEKIARIEKLRDEGKSIGVGVGDSFRIHIGGWGKDDERELQGYYNTLVGLQAAYQSEMRKKEREAQREREAAAKKRAENEASIQQEADLRLISEVEDRLKAKRQKLEESHKKELDAYTRQGKDLTQLKARHAQELADLDAQESARHTASLNKRIQGSARAAREQEQIAKGYYDYIGKGAKGSIEAAMAEEKRLYELRTAENQKAKISAEELAKWQAKTDEEYKRRQDEHNKKLLDAASQYYRYVGEQADGYLEHQIKVLEAHRDAELKRAEESIKDAEKLAKAKETIQKRHEKNVTDLVNTDEHKRQAIRENIQQKIFNLTATDAEKRQAALTRELADYRKQLTEAGDYTAEEIERVLDQYREAYERANDPVVKDFQKAWDSAVERLDNSFLDLWKSFLEGGKASLDAFKGLFKNLLAELAHAALTRPIIMQIGGAVSGSLLGSAATTALAGQQGGGAAGMLGNLPFGSLFSGGSGGIANSINSWAASSFPGVWGAGGLLGPSAVNSGYTAAISNPPLYTSGMGFSSEAVATGALQGTGYGTATNTTSTVAGTGTSFLSTIGGLAGIGGGIYQMTQGGAGNTVGGAGTAIGGAMMFTPAAPFAPLVMLGSQLLGGLLGGKKEHSPSVIFQAQDMPWGQTEGYQFHTKSKGSKKTGAELAAALGQISGAVYEQIEETLDAFGEQYVDMLKDATISWGRKSGGLWKEWDFGSDMNFEELMGKAAEDLQKQIYKAAGPAFSKIGEDFLDSDAVKDAYALLENKAKQFGKIEDVIRAGVQDGNIEAYLEQLRAFQAAIANTTATWQAVSQASAEVVEPLSAYAQQQRQLNAQFDQWIVGLAALGIAQENIQKIEEDRTAALAKMAEDNAKAIQLVIDASAETVTPLSELEQAQRQINAQFDGFIAQLESLGATTAQVVKVEEDRKAALVKAADEVSRAEAERNAAQLKAESERHAAQLKAAEDNARAIENILKTSAGIVTPLNSLERAQQQINSQFDGLISQLKGLGAAVGHIIQVEAHRQSALAKAAQSNAAAIDAVVEASYGAVLPLNQLRQAQYQVSSQFDGFIAQLRNLGARGEHIVQVMDNYHAALARVREENIRAINEVFRASSDAAGTLTAFGQAQREVNEQFDGFRAQLKDLAADDWQFAKVEVDRRAALKRVTEENAKAIGEVLRASSEAIKPLTGLAGAQRQINEQYNEYIAQLKDLEATSAQVAKVEADRRAALAHAANENAKAISAITRASAESVKPLNALGQAQRQINDQFDGYSEQLKNLGATAAQITKIENDRRTALARAATENANARADVLRASADSVAQLSTLGQAQRQINDQFDGFIKQLKELGATSAQLTKIESDRKTLLARAAAEQTRSIKYMQAELSETVDKFMVREIAGRYKWGANYLKGDEVNRANVQKDFIDWFKKASEQAILNKAASNNVTWEQLGQDVKFLDDYFKRLDAAAKETASEFERVTKALVSFRGELLTREESGLTVEERYRAAENEFARISQLASLGDKEALERLQEVSNRYLSVSGEYHATADDYKRSSNAVLAALDTGARESGKKAGVDMKELKREVQQLREEQAAANYQLIKWIQSVARISNRWDNDGMPGVRQ